MAAPWCWWLDTETRRRPRRARFRPLVTGVALAAALLVPRAVRGADGAATAPASPRSTVEAFLAADGVGAEADLLDSARQPPARRDQLAKRLRAILQQTDSFDPSELSDAPAGALDDGIAPRLEIVAQVAGPDGALQPVRMERYQRGDVQAWRFTAGTVSRIDGWYRAIDPGWLGRRMPAPLWAAGPYGLPWWQWIALVVLVTIGLVVGRVLGRLTELGLGRIARRTTTSYDDELLRAASGPLTAFWSLLAMRGGVSLVGLSSQASSVAAGAIGVSVYMVFFWALMRAGDMACNVASHSGWARRSPSSRSLLPLARRTFKALVFVVAVVAVISSLGYPVASLVAGLGVGGIAIALAAQKTVENLFGAFSLGVDQPIREGDFVKVEDLVGTVEAIGLRSTRLRTLDRTLVTIPNGRLADMRLESFAARDRLRLACTLGLLYSTSTSELQEVVARVRSMLGSHPKIWPDSINVYVTGLGEFSINVDIMCWFATTSWDEFQQIRSDVYLELINIVRACGSDFAFPTRTLELSATATEALLAGAAAVERPGSESTRRERPS
jgi:MscS family membrane protein